MLIGKGKMSVFDFKLYLRVAYFALLLPLASGEYIIVCNTSI